MTVALQDALRVAERGAAFGGDAAARCVRDLEQEGALAFWLIDALPSLAAVCRHAPADTQGSLVVGCLRVGGRVLALRQWVRSVAPRLLRVDPKFPLLDLYADCYLALDAWVIHWNRQGAGPRSDDA